MHGSNESVSSTAAIDQAALFAQHIEDKKKKHHFPPSNGVVTALVYTSSQSPEDQNFNTNGLYHDGEDCVAASNVNSQPHA